MSDEVFYGAAVFLFHHSIHHFVTWNPAKRVLRLRNGYTPGWSDRSFTPAKRVLRPVYISITSIKALFYTRREDKPPAGEIPNSKSQIPNKFQ
jgi:hypothetical protein